MSLYQDIRHNRAADKLAPFAFASRINVLAHIRVGPAVESAVLYFCNVVGHEVVAQEVALLHGGPESARPRIKGQTYGIARPRSDDSFARAIRVVLYDSGAHRIGFDAHV